jgi:hypothetical protein
MPRLSVLIDGTDVPGAIEARVVSTNYYSCDWFDISFALTEAQGFGASYWLEAHRPLVEVRVAMTPHATPVSLVMGYADTVSIDPLRNTASVHGRDLSALFVDSSLHRTFPNPMASEIVGLLALGHGLIPKIIPTPGLVGRGFGGSNNLTGDAYYSRTNTDWDLIVRLACEFGYDAFVEGRTFHFEPAGLTAGGPFQVSRDDVVQVRLSRDIQSETTRNLRLISWNSQLQREVSYLPHAYRDGSPGVEMGVLEPNLTPERMGTIANHLLRGTQSRSTSLQLTMPGDTALTARARIGLHGFSGSIDAVYNVECIDRNLSPTTGFLQRIRAAKSYVI